MSSMLSCSACFPGFAVIRLPLTLFLVLKCFSAKWCVFKFMDEDWRLWWVRVFVYPLPEREMLECYWWFSESGSSDSQMCLVICVWPNYCNCFLQIWTLVTYLCLQTKAASHTEREALLGRRNSVRAKGSVAVVTECPQAAMTFNSSRTCKVGLGTV